MDTNERLNKMARLVFNKGNLEQLREGINEVMDVFGELLEVPFEHGNCFSHDELMVRIEAVEQKKWRPIRNMFLLDPYYGYFQGNFSETENDSPAKILLDVVNFLDKVAKECYAKLEGYQQIVTRLNKDKRDMEGQLYRLEMKESEQRIAFSNDRAQAKTSRSTIEYLEKMVKEKNEKIAELQREKNVQLWEREKERVMSEAQSKIDFLEHKIEDLKKQNDALQKKFALADEQQRKLKIKTEILAGEVPPSQNKSEEELKRLLYLQEKDVTALERELLSQQRVFSTILNGIKTDLFIVGENLTDPDTGQIQYKDFVSLSGMVQDLTTAMANGDIEGARSGLPAHYNYLPSDFKIKRVKRVSGLAKDRLPPIQKAELKVDELNGNTSSSDADYTVETIVDNPQLVNPQDDVVNFVSCMKHFPHLSVDFIKEHWAKFKEFDANGDQSLDFGEVVKALTAMGMHFSATQAEEAMKEADLNNSRSLDFYEYVMVADKLFHKTGKSELFHNTTKDRKVLSKTCVIQ